MRDVRSGHRLEQMLPRGKHKQLWLHRWCWCACDGMCRALVRCLHQAGLGAQHRRSCFRALHATANLLRAHRVAEPQTPNP